MVDVRRLNASQWLVLRELRLAALTDTPDAFAASFTDERDHDDAYWVDAARRQAWFVAWSGEHSVGLAAGSASWDCELAERDLVAMWVDPGHRRRGIGSMLVDAVRGWAAEQGADALALWVIDGNQAAKSAYLTCGFTEVYTAPLLRDPSRTAQKLALALG